MIRRSVSLRLTNPARLPRAVVKDAVCRVVEPTNGGRGVVERVVEVHRAKPFFVRPPEGSASVGQGRDDRTGARRHVVRDFERHAASRIVSWSAPRGDGHAVRVRRPSIAGADPHPHHAGRGRPCESGRRRRRAPQATSAGPDRHTPTVALVRPPAVLRRAWWSLSSAVVAAKGQAVTQDWRARSGSGSRVSTVRARSRAGPGQEGRWGRPIGARPARR